AVSGGFVGAGTADDFLHDERARAGSGHREPDLGETRGDAGGMKRAGDAVAGEQGRQDERGIAERPNAAREPQVQPGVGLDPLPPEPRVVMARDEHGRRRPERERQVRTLKERGTRGGPALGGVAGVAGAGGTPSSDRAEPAGGVTSSPAAVAARGRRRPGGIGG